MGRLMEVGLAIPEQLIGFDPAVLRDYAVLAEEMGFSYLTVTDHVLGATHAGRHPPFPTGGVYNQLGFQATVAAREGESIWSAIHRWEEAGAPMPRSRQRRPTDADRLSRGQRAASCSTSSPESETERGITSDRHACDEMDRSTIVRRRVWMCWKNS